ncbi:metallophosphoesterase [Candidatus Micrarchaeota archaeon]|nr:metallophosphoesterase [Candidatus Micrarchaeota archaeon]
MEMPLVSNVAERELLQAAESHQMLLEPEALRELLLCDEPRQMLEHAVAVAQDRNEFMVSHSLVADLIAARQLERKSVVVVPNARFDAPAKGHEPDIRIFKDREVTRKSRCTGRLEDFVEHFKDRFSRMKGLMTSRRSEYPLMDRLSRAAGKGQREKMRLIGMVYEKRTTKNGHVLVELEDETATVTALVSKNSKILGLTSGLMEDEVVALDGFFNGELFIIDDIVWPDVPIREPKRGGADVNIGFLSDLHVGSKYFLQHQFQHFLGFLNGKGTEEEQELSGKIKYLFIAGDLVDGIGVYPTQEKQLVTKDIYEQYKNMSEFLMQVPEHIHVILAPGNHDAVRTAEPQPALFDEFAQGLEKKDNMHLVGNPAWFEVEGLKVLMYHGTSLDSLIASMNKPE